MQATGAGLGRSTVAGLAVACAAWLAAFVWCWGRIGPVWAVLVCVWGVPLLALPVLLRADRRRA